MSYYTYERYAGYQVYKDELCGNLEYERVASTESRNFMSMNAFKDPKKVLINFFADDEFIKGVKTFQIRVKSDLVKKAPTYVFDISLDVLSCYVQEYIIGEQYMSGGVFMLGQTNTQGLKEFSYDPPCTLV